MSDKWESEVSNLIYCFLSNFLRASWERSLGNRKWIFFFPPSGKHFLKDFFFFSLRMQEMYVISNWSLLKNTLNLTLKFLYYLTYIN